MKKIFKAFVYVISSVVALLIAFIIIMNVYNEEKVKSETKALVLKKNPQISKIYSIHRKGFRSLEFELIVQINGENYRTFTQMGSGNIDQLLPPPVELN